MSQPPVTIGEFNKNISARLLSVADTGGELPITNHRFPGDYVTVVPTWLWNALVTEIGEAGVDRLREQHQTEIDAQRQEHAA